jgi:hypothetical protein
MSHNPGMNAQDELRAAIDREWIRLQAGVPGDRDAAVPAVLHARDRRGADPGRRLPDLITGHRIADLGGNRAIQLCLQADDAAGPGDDPHQWAERLLNACDRLAEAEIVLGHCETGFMRLVDDECGCFDAWIATKRVPPGWRERADVDWWADSLAHEHAPDVQALQAETSRDEGHFQELASVYIKRMAYQFGYPDDAVLGGCSVQVYRDVLRWLIAVALQAREQDDAAPVFAENELAERIAVELAIDPFIVREALAGFTVDRENAGYHAAVPGVAAAPLVRFGGDRIALSWRGMTTEPLLFLTRELRRRDAQAYHNSAFLREDVFRRDIYALFADRRFVTSSGRIQLRRKEGNLRTDIDAAVFDRKSGTLALFELKSQDPFARSTAELQRQRDNLLYANRQLSGTLDWIKHHGADEILERIDRRSAKTFRAHKVYPFVLGRYLAHFNDGAAPDPRAAWATWPQLLRLLDQQPIKAGDANPIASLFTRLAKDPAPITVPEDIQTREIAIGDLRLRVYPSYAAMQKPD